MSDAPAPSLPPSVPGPVPGPGPGLGCVAVPIVARDIDGGLAEILALWSDVRFRPGGQAEAPRPHLMVVVNSASEDQITRIQTLYKGFPALAAAFSGFSVYSAGLEGARDVYAPDGGATGPVLGRKAGPNFLFRRLIELGAAQGGFTLQLELDCLPAGPGWLAAVQGVIGDHPRAWVIGSHYAGAGLLGADAKSHLNGNALYHTGDPRFRAFFNDIWMPRLLHQIRTRPDLAHDWWWAVERHEADARANNTSWQLFQTYDHFFQADPFVVNLAVPEDGARAYAQVFDRFAGLGRAPVFLHGPAMNAVRSALLQHRQNSIFEVLDLLDPPKNPAGTDRQSKTLPPERILLQAAADLLQPGSEEAAADAERAQRIRAACDALAEDHPARVHYERVRAHMRRHQGSSPARSITRA